MAVTYRSRTEIAGIRKAGQVVMSILAELRAAVRPGVTTGELDAIAAAGLARHHAQSNFQGYSPHPGVPPFPGVICASVNEEVVHGIPGKRALREGDLIAIDFGAIVDGWHGDSAVTLPVGAVAPEAARLLAVTQEALRRGIAAARANNHVSDISRAIQTYVEGEGMSLVRQYGGHGIGRALHEDPHISNTVDSRAPDLRLRPGLVICIEPMVNLGGAATRELRDRWTVVTADGSLSAHFEHTVAVMPGDPLVLTDLAAEEARTA
jgi:methionyl aminopeptidase